MIKIMRLIRTFFTTLWRTFTDPHYYADVVKASFGFSFKYFLFFYLLLSAVMTIFVTVQVLPRAKTVAESGVDTLVSLYPDGLELTMDFEAGELSTEGVTEPIMIPLPVDSELDDNIQIRPEIENLLVIDTTASVNDYSNYKTVALATKTELVVMADENLARYQVIPFSQFGTDSGSIETENGGELKSFMVDKPLLTNQVPVIKEFLNMLLKMAPWFIFLGVVIFMVVSRMMYLLFMSLLLMVFGMLLGKRLTYGKFYQIGMHTVTIADAITKIQFLLYPTIFPFLFTLAFLGTSVFALMGIKKRK